MNQRDEELLQRDTVKKESSLHLANNSSINNQGVLENPQQLDGYMRNSIVKTGAYTTKEFFEQLSLFAQSTQDQKQIIFYKSAIAGHNAYILEPSKLEAKKLPAKLNVFPPNQIFTGSSRTNLLDDIDGHVKSTKKNSKTSVIVTCHGIDGIGKSTFTLEYIWKHDSEFNGIVWLNAEDKQQLIREYINLGEQLNIFTNAKGIIVSPEEELQKAKWVKAWFENRAEPDWLMVINDLDNYTEVRELIPVSSGVIWINSPREGMEGRSFKLEPFTPAESKEYAEKVIGKERVKQQENDINKLIKKLGGLPLALAQAFTIIKRGMSIQEYLVLYKSSRHDLLAKKLFPTADVHDPVTITWNVTLQKMSQEVPESVELLYCLAFLHYLNIPTILIDYLMPNKSRVDILCAKDLAKQYSMITFDSSETFFSMHKLVQWVIQYQLIQQNRAFEYIQRTSYGLNKIYPFRSKNRGNYKIKKPLLRHLEKVLLHLNTIRNLPNLSVDVKNRLEQNCILKCLIIYGEACWYFGRIDEQMNSLTRALNISKKYAATTKNERIIILTCLGICFGLSNKIDDAFQHLFEASRLEDERQLEYGESEKTDNDDVQEPYIAAYLGHTYVKQKKIEEAISLFQKVINKYGTRLEKNDPLILAVLYHNLSNAYEAKKDYESTISYLEKSLKIKEKEFDPDNINISVTLTNLGNVNLLLNKIEEAEKFLRRSFDIDNKHFSSTYPLRLKNYTGLCRLSLLKNDLLSVEFYYKLASEINITKTKEITEILMQLERDIDDLRNKSKSNNKPVL